MLKKKLNHDNEKKILGFLPSFIPSDVYAVGLVSLLLNISTTAVFASINVFLFKNFDADCILIGLFEGYIFAISQIVRLFAGILSDYFQNRKILMIIGTVCASIAFPILACAGSVFIILISRTIDRIGNGMQAAPRDAMISDMAPEGKKGACLALRNCMALIGSILGTILVIIIIKMTNSNFRILFWIAGIPAVLSGLFLAFFVKEKKIQTVQNIEKESKRRKISWKDIFALGKKFWFLMLVLTVVSFGRVGEGWIALHAFKTFNMNASIMINMVLCIVSAIVVYPFGKITDKKSKKNKMSLLLCAFVILLLAQLILGIKNNIYVLFLGAALWGIQLYAMNNLFAALILEYVSKKFIGTAFGIFYSIQGVIGFFTNVGFGKLGYLMHSDFDYHAFYLIAAIFSLLAIIILYAGRKILKDEKVDA